MKEPAYIRRLKARGIRVSADGKVSARAADREIQKMEDKYLDMSFDYFEMKDHLEEKTLKEAAGLLPEAP